MRKTVLKKKSKPIVVEIPHLAYTINIKVDLKQFTGSQSTWRAFAQHDNSYSSTIYLREKPKLEKVFLVSHEVMHCLQWMCRDRNIDMEYESEHMAYLMQYVLGRAFGYKIMK